MVKWPTWRGTGRGSPIHSEQAGNASGRKKTNGAPKCSNVEVIGSGSLHLETSVDLKGWLLRVVLETKVAGNFSPAKTCLRIRELHMREWLVASKNS